MTDNEINSVIAEVCGKPEPHWWCPSCQREVSPHMVRYNETHDGCGTTCELRDTPSYCTDLNAMHDAEAQGIMQVEGFFRSYLLKLRQVTGQAEPIDATARQRAEAFLRTHNLWHDH